MISCKRASELISKSADEKLGTLEYLQLKIHLFICEFCRQFEKNIFLLRSAVSALRSESRETQDATSSEFRHRVKLAVNETLEKKQSSQSPEQEGE